MSGDGRKLRLIRTPDVVWVPIVNLPWRPDWKDKKPCAD